jgi:hypothetical protein
VILFGEPAPYDIEIPGMLPPPPDPFINMEFFIGIPTNDNIQFALPPGSPFTLSSIDSNNTTDELGRLSGKFGEDPINRCSEGVWQCGKIEFGDGFTFETEIFTDGFESGDISSWSTGAAADNSTSSKKDKPVGVLNEDKKLPVITEEELRKAIELFNDDIVFDEKTIGLVSERFGVMEPLPLIRGTYFFDEFESFRKSAGQPPVTLDGSNCPAPCSGLVLEGGNSGINGITFTGFPDFGVVLESDSNTVTNSEFDNNGLGGILIADSVNTVGGTEEDGNAFINNGGPGIVVRSGIENSILHNVFSGNAGPGIDLGEDGVTANDAGDGDTGPNSLQNYPILTNVQVQSEGRGPRIEGTLNSTANTSFSLQFFASASCDPSGNGEGALILGSADITTDASGNGAFDTLVPGGAASGEFVTATATDAAGNTSEFSACIEVTIVGVDDEGKLPTEYALFSNYPNPFNPGTTIKYALPKTSEVRLTIFNLRGQPVRTVVKSNQPAGFHTVEWDGRDEAGVTMASGMYLYKIEAGSFVQTRKMMLMK